MKRILLAVLTIIGINVFAQDTIISLSDVTISSTRFHETPTTSTTIVLDSITLMGQETPQVLSKISPSVFSQSDNGTPFGYSYFTLRGMSQNRIQYSINGVPLNEGEDLSVYTTNTTDLFSNVSSLELLRGASISGSGNASFVGGLEMISKSPFGKQSGEVSGMYGSFKSYRASAAYTTGEIAPGFGATIRVSMTGSNGFRYNSYGESQSSYVSFGYRSGIHTIKFNSFVGNTRNGQSWLPVPEGMNPRTNILTVGAPVQPDHFIQSIEQIQYSCALGTYWAFNFSPYISTINGNYDLPNDSLRNANLSLKSINPGAFFNFKFNNSRLNFIFGGNLNYYQRKHEFSIRPYTDEHIYENMGKKCDFNFYSRSSYLLFKHFRTSVDLQWRCIYLDYVSKTYNIGLYNEQFFNYSVGGDFPFQIKNIQFDPYVTFSQVGREPARTDMLPFGNIDTTEKVYKQIVGVSPEINRDLEFGVKIKGKNFDVNLNGFYMNVRHEILSTGQFDLVGIMGGENVEKSQRVGIELSANYHYNILRGGVNFSYQDSKYWLPAGGTKVPLLSPNEILYVYQGVYYKGFKANLSYQFVSSSFLESSNKPSLTLPTVSLLNLELGYTYRMVTFDLLVYNLTNHNQTFSGTADVSSMTRNFFYSAGISAYGSIKIKF